MSPSFSIIWNDKREQDKPRFHATQGSRGKQETIYNPLAGHLSRSPATEPENKYKQDNQSVDGTRILRTPCRGENMGGA